MDSPRLVLTGLVSWKAPRGFGVKKLLLTLSSVMITFLHHSDPTIPHFRKEEWSFLRGAASTVDRPTLGWIGRFFFHNVSRRRRTRTSIVKAGLTLGLVFRLRTTTSHTTFSPTFRSVRL